MARFTELAAGLVCAAALTAALVSGAESSPARPEALRLHVIANSDDPEDQRLKLLVRDALLETYGGAEATSKEEACSRLLAMGPELQAAAERTLRENGSDDPVVLEAGEFDFPDRTYGSETFPAGRYTALRVVIGAGEGQNWWCVMFPPLCVIDDGSGVRYDEDGTLAFRSWIAEIWRGIFG